MTQDSPAQPAAKTSNKRRNKYLLIAALIFVCLGIVVLIYWLLIGQFYESTNDAYVAGNTVEVMPQISGQVTTILAEETTLVNKGDKLVYLDRADVDIALKNAKAQLALITREVSQYFHNVDQLKANVLLQQDNFERAKEDFDRRQGLVVNKTISNEELQHAKTALNTAKDNVVLAKEQLDAAEDVVGKTDIYHHPRVEQAAVVLRNAYLNWLRSIIYAPVTGYVAKRAIQVGQQVTTNTVMMTIVPSHQIWIEANFKESQLKNIRLNQPAEVIADTYGNDIKYHGIVIGFSPGTGSAFDLLPPQNATGNWIKIVQRLPVRIELDPKEIEKYPLQIGLSMTVTVDTHKKEAAPLSIKNPTKILYQTDNYYENAKYINQLVEDIITANTGNITHSPVEENNNHAPH